MAEMGRAHPQTPIPPLSSSLYLLPLEDNRWSQIKEKSKRKLEDYLDPILLHTISSRISRTETKQKQIIGDVNQDIFYRDKPGVSNNKKHGYDPVGSVLSRLGAAMHNNCLNVADSDTAERLLWSPVGTLRQLRSGVYTVGEFMTKKEDLHVVKPTTTVDEALEILVEKKITGFPLIDEDWKLELKIERTKAAAAIKAIQERMEDKLKTEIEQKETEALLALSKAEELAKAELTSAIAK